MMLGLKADFDNWLRTAAEESSDELMDREAGAMKAAVCRSRDERTADAIFTIDEAEVGGLMCVFFDSANQARGELLSSVVEAYANAAVKAPESGQETEVVNCDARRELL